jgi:hypothetical protein
VIDSQDQISLFILTAGVVLVGLGLIRYFLDVPAGVPSATRPASGKTSRAGWIAAIGLALLTLALAMEDIERRGLAHPEVYVPGIDLPAGITEPPPRLTLGETLYWQFHSDVHPLGYYGLMWGWTRVFGTDLTTMRLPSVLAGVASVLCLFALGARYGPAVGLLAAGMLAINGHHIYWMQNARMYTLAVFLALASVLLLIRILQNPDSRRHQLGYLVVTTAGLYTQIYFWPFLASQMLYVFFAARTDEKVLPPALALQALVVMLGSPMLAHLVYQMVGHAAQLPTSWSFVQSFLNFGFLFTPDTFALEPRDAPATLKWLLTGMALACLVAFAGSKRFRHDAVATGEHGKQRVRGLVPVAAGCALVLYAISREVWRNETGVALTAIVPVLALVCLVAAQQAVARFGAMQWGLLRLLGHSPVVNAGLVTFLIVALMGLATPLINARAMLVAVPFFLLVLAGGLAVILARWRVAGIALLVMLVLASGYSVEYFRNFGEPNDYRGLARQLQAELQPGDRIFVRKGDWVITPVFYYLDHDPRRLVADDFASAVADPDVRTVWVLQFSDIPLPLAMTAALREFETGKELVALRSRAIRFTR